MNFSQATGSIGNGLIVITFIKQPFIRQNGRGLYLIGLLSVGDFYLEFGTMFAAVARLYDTLSGRLHFTRLNCLMKAFPTVVGIYVSHTLTALLAYDRYIAMSYPLQYVNTEVLEHPKLKLFAVFGCSFLNALTMFVGIDLSSEPLSCRFGTSAHRISVLHYAFTVLTLGVLVFYFYVRALLALKSSHVKVDGHHTVNQASANAHKLQVKVTRTTATILGIYCILWIVPNLLFISISTSDPELRGRLSPYLGLCSALNSALNVFAYSTKSSVIRPYLIATVKNKLYVASNPH